jgi:6-hydroxytryprostatin B O-methyltransferase
MAIAAPSPGQSLEDLALQISHLAYTCSSLLKAAQKPPLTTTSDGPEASEARSSLPSDIRSQLAEAALDLWSIAIGPEERVRRLAIDWSIPSALRYIVHFSIPDLVPQTGETSYVDLAAAAKVPEAHLKRIIRLASTAGIFRESMPGYVAHTMLSVRLSSAYPELSNYAAHCLEFSFPVAARMPEMSERWAGSEAKTHTAFNVAYDTEEPLFKWLQHEPAHAGRFAKLMGAMRKNPTWDVKHLVEGWEGWAELEKGAKIVDVGGSVGHASVALAEKYDGLTFVVQDLGYVVAQAKEAKSVPETLEGRVQLEAHDFFIEQPVKDADVYLLRQILHDWADESAIRILKGIVPALQKRGSRILIMDQVVPPPGTLQRSSEREARTVDLVVMSHFNGKQRDLEEWHKILEAADERLKIANVVQPMGSHFSIIEVILIEPEVISAEPEAISTDLEAISTEPEIKSAEPEVKANDVTTPIEFSPKELLPNYGGNPLIVDSEFGEDGILLPQENLEVVQAKENGVHPVPETVVDSGIDKHDVEPEAVEQPESLVHEPESMQNKTTEAETISNSVKDQTSPVTEDIKTVSQEAEPVPEAFHESNGKPENNMAAVTDADTDCLKAVRGLSEPIRATIVA